MPREQDAVAASFGVANNSSRYAAKAPPSQFRDANLHKLRPMALATSAILVL